MKCYCVYVWLVLTSFMFACALLFGFVAVLDQAWAWPCAEKSAVRSRDKMSRVRRDLQRSL